jgi:mono/diheme cytochrome c family protein
MQRLPLIACASLACVLAACTGAVAASPPRAMLDAGHKDFLAAHCAACHAGETPEANFRIDDLPLALDTVAAAERWQKVLGALNSGEMPPADETQPEAAAKADFLDVLAKTMVVARKSLADQGGRIAMRRLNRREYRNTLRDLLGVEVDVSDLPADTSPLAFDTVGASLFMTASQFEQYEAIGRDALAAAFKKHAAAGVKKQFRQEAETTLATFKKANEKLQTNQQAAREWFQKLDAAVASPENAAFVAKTRPTLKSEEEFKFHWRSLVGLPAPDDAVPKSGNNPQFLTAILEEKRFIPYEEHYLSMPGLDTGAYLAVPAGPRAPNSNSRLNLDIPADWPPGEYVIRIRCAARPEAAPDRRFIEFGHRHYGDRMPAISAHHVTGTMNAPQVIEIPYTLTDAGSDPAKRRFAFREIGTGSSAAVRKLFDEGVKANGIGPELAIWVDWIEIERAIPAASDVPPGITALQPLLDTQNADAIPPEKAKRAVEQFIAEAYRGVKPAKGEVERLAGIYAARRGLGAKHGEALTEALVSVLSSPRFLYRAEPGPDDGRRDLDGLEVATRLSYFLWGAPPDATLRGLATSGELLEPAVLEAQTNRLLDDPRSGGFVEPFVSQWLAMYRLDFFQFDLSLYPKFDDSTKAAARREVYETFAWLLSNNGRLADLLKADYVVVNGLLADYYGLEGVHGDEFRRAPLPAGSPRGGLLGMAAVHAMGSNGEHSSPVERGAWVLRKLLNDPPPPAPPNIPQLSRLAGKSLTARERVVLHQEAPQCASCHRKIDPIGFGMENFDAVGSWRTTDSSMAINADGKPDPKTKKTWTIDPAGALHGGPAFKDFFELREIVAARPEQFARGFTAALIEYALGRPCGFGDEPLVDAIVKDASSHDLATRSFIHSLVQSKAFRTK